MATTAAQARARKRRRRDGVKARLQAAMLELAAERSFREIRIDEIAGAAGLSRSAFYFYYPDKRSLLLEAAAEVVDTLYRQADLWWHGDGPPRELLAKALRENAETWREHGLLLRMAVEVSTYDEEVREFWRSLLGRFVGAAVERVREDQEAGIVPPEVDPEPCAEVLVLATERVLYGRVTTGERSVDEVVEMLTPIWMRLLYPDS